MNELEDLYREIILDHYRNPRNRGVLSVPPAITSEGLNPLCGDEISIYLDIDPNGIVQEIKFQGRGCSISQSSASIMTDSVKNKSIGEILDLISKFKIMMNVHEKQDEDEEIHVKEDLIAQNYSSMGEVAALQGVVRFPVRIKCALLAWNTLLEALKEAEVKKD